MPDRIAKIEARLYHDETAMNRQDIRYLLDKVNELLEDRTTLHGCFHDADKAFDLYGKTLDENKRLREALLRIFDDNFECGDHVKIAHDALEGKE